MRPLQENYPDTADRLKKEAYQGIDPAIIVKEKNIRDEGYDIIARFNFQEGVKNTDTWNATEKAKKLPEYYLSVDEPLPPRFQKIWDLR
jgi:choline-sulfatase